MAFTENSDPIRDLDIGLIKIDNWMNGTVYPLYPNNNIGTKLYDFLVACSTMKNIDRYVYKGAPIIEFSNEELIKVIKTIFNLYVNNFYYSRNPFDTGSTTNYRDGFKYPPINYTKICGYILFKIFSNKERSFKI
jgi:hypothetical protein